MLLRTKLFTSNICTVPKIPQNFNKSSHFIQNRKFRTTTVSFSGQGATHYDTPENHEHIPFDFTQDNLKHVKTILSKYPDGYKRGAMIPLLHLAQNQNAGWLPLAAMNKVAKMLEVAPINVYEVASFYTMFNRSPIGKHHVQVCTTTPCMLRGAYEILETCEKHLNIQVGETTPDKMFTLGEVECAGACVNAPMLSVGDDYYEDLTPETTIKVLQAFQKGERPKWGPQVANRKTCEPIGKKTSLTEPPMGPYAPRDDL